MFNKKIFSSLIIGLFTLGATSLYANPKVLGTPSEKPKKEGWTGRCTLCPAHLHQKKYCKSKKIDGERACSFASCEGKCAKAEAKEDKDKDKDKEKK